MDWLRDFQQSLREPVFGFLQSYWPFILPLAFPAGWWLCSALYRPRRSERGDAGAESDLGDGGDGGD